MLSEQSFELVELVAKLGSFTSAANHLNKVPSAISYAVKQIEDELGVELFERHHRSVSLTPAGEHFVNQAKSLMLSIAELKHSTLAVNQGWRPTIGIALDGLVREDGISYLVREFYKAFADVELHIYREQINGCWQALNEQRCDIAIGAASNIPVGGPYEHRAIGELSWQFVVAADHPLATELHITHSKLNNYAGVCVCDTAAKYPATRLGLAPGQRALAVPDWIRAINCVKDGLAVGCLPSHLIAPFVDNGSLIVKSSDLQINDSPALLVWNRNVQHEAMNWLIDYLTRDKRLVDSWLSKN
ncbi:LysR family transcriptional regulator [Shewanella avicenniae]|uniref:LysR family transcriptional regulator n=1 Tax=Shewanella avicenniae TaxID=2814294 RepID=A0ABX7QXB4_9GAMM|nr:DNA-binding transcriptional activator PunR [Shewanella avicenniae]QSX35286.1 LysR family transcriptional regulator [Shewanella avicenniae]